MKIIVVLLFNVIKILLEQSSRLVVLFAVRDKVARVVMTHRNRWEIYDSLSCYTAKGNRNLSRLLSMSHHWTLAQTLVHEALLPQGVNLSYLYRDVWSWASTPDPYRSNLIAKKLTHIGVKFLKVYPYWCTISQVHVAMDMEIMMCFIWPLLCIVFVYNYSELCYPLRPPYLRVF